MFSVIYIKSQPLASQGIRRVYLETAVVHLLEEAVGATRLVIALRVVALYSNLGVVEFHVTAAGAVDLCSGEGAFGCRG